MLNEILVILGAALARNHADNTLPSATLCAVGTDVGAFDQPIVSKGDNHALICDEVFDGNLAFIGNQIGKAWVGVLFFDEQQLVFDNREDPSLFGQNIQQIINSLQKRF